MTNKKRRKGETLLEAKLLKKIKNKQARDARAGRQRNIRKAAKCLYKRFQKDEKERLNFGRTPQQAYAGARSEAEIFLKRQEYRVKDKPAVFRIFMEFLSTHPRP